MMEHRLWAASIPGNHIVSQSKPETKSNHRHPTPKQGKRKYSTPRLDHLGSLSEMTQMPGGSINVEGASGKPHQQ